MWIRVSNTWVNLSLVHCVDIDDTKDMITRTLHHGDKYTKLSIARMFIEGQHDTDLYNRVKANIELVDAYLEEHRL